MYANPHAGKQADLINDSLNNTIKLATREKQLLRHLQESPELIRKQLAEKSGCLKRGL